MTDNDVLEKKMHELREIGEKHAKARGNVSLLEHGRKILLSTIMKEVMVKGKEFSTIAAQEREARADDRYQTHISALAIAIEEETKWAWEKKIVDMNFESWKTKMINQTVERKKYA
jgi:hypothetical protein|tara:strand:- start:1460 stop:1807 length:348 start_codon:yes stop_codon:yes gene_type:complete